MAIIEARVKQKTGTLSEWMANDLILLDGEQAFVVSNDGSPVNFKIGDGTKTFAELPFWIAYDQAAFVAVSGNTLPASDGNVHYSIVPAGTYTQTGGADVVVPSGSFGIISDDGTGWSLVDMGELPEVQGTDVLNPEGENVPKEKATANYVKPLFDLTETVVSKNLINKEDIVSGSWAFNSSGQPVKSASVNWISTNIITVNDSENMNYYLQGMRPLLSSQLTVARVLFWDGAGNYISSIKGADNNLSEFSITPPVFPFKFALNIANVVGIGNDPQNNQYANSLMFNKGAKLPYEPWGSKVGIPVENIFGLDYSDLDKYIINKQSGIIEMYYYAGGNPKNWINLTFWRSIIPAKFVDVWRLSTVSLVKRTSEFTFSKIYDVTTDGVWENALYTTDAGYTDALGSAHGWETNTSVKLLIDNKEIPINSDFGWSKASIIFLETESNFLTVDGASIRGTSSKNWKIERGGIDIENDIKWMIPTIFQDRSFVAMWSILRDEDGGNNVTNRGMADDEWKYYDISKNGFTNPLFVSKQNDRSSVVLEGKSLIFEMNVSATPSTPTRGMWVQNTIYNKIYYQMGELTVAANDEWNIKASYQISVK